MPGKEKSGMCALCGREVARLTQHHLIPRTRHSNRRNKKRFSRQEVRQRRIDVCWPCHKTIHAALTEKELEEPYNTAESLRSHPEIAKFIRWVRKQTDSHIPVRRSSESRRRRKAITRKPRKAARSSR